jgi:hypothetical protein
MIRYQDHNVNISNCCLINNLKNGQGVLLNHYFGTGVLFLLDCYIDIISGEYSIIIHL